MPHIPKRIKEDTFCRDFLKSITFMKKKKKAVTAEM